ncbi:MAG: GTPase [Actinomycetota bacterium]
MNDPATEDGDLGPRTDALLRAADLAGSRVAEEAITTARRTAERVRERLTHGTRHTVVALAGPTGSGKSSLFNALVGSEVARVGVTRPTTGRAQAAVFGAPTGVDELFGWLGIRDRHVLEDPPDDLEGLVLVDLPDFDSTVAEHRVEVDRLIELVDLLVWVVDPQKYADEALHLGYLRDLVEHAGVQRFVLAKTDLLTADQGDAVSADLSRRLGEDGLGDAPVWPVATTDGSGLDALRSGLVEAVAGREAMVRRLEADVRVAAEPLGRGADEAPTVVGRGDRADLVAGLSAAAGVPVLADAAATDHRAEARRAMGWPPVRWFRRRRPARLTGRRIVDGPDPVVDATAVGAALRELAESVGGPLGPPWDRGLRRETLARRDDVAATLGGVVLSAARDAGRRPRWWWLFAQLQWLALIVAAVGLGWLVLLIALSALRLDTDALTPEVGIFPLPTLLLGAGLLAGWLLSLIARIPAAVGARRRRSRARSRLDDVVETVAADDVIAGVEAVLADRAEVARLVGVAHG